MSTPSTSKISEDSIKRCNFRPSGKLSSARCVEDDALSSYLYLLLCIITSVTLISSDNSQGGARMRKRIEELLQHLIDSVGCSYSVKRYSEACLSFMMCCIAVLFIPVHSLVAELRT